MSGEYMLPNSPQQSTSSINIDPKPIQTKSSPKIPEGKCCWQNCGMVFETLEILGEHIHNAHSDRGVGGLYYCHWEGCARNKRGFNGRFDMLRHVRIHTNEKPYQCTLCLKAFSRAENLRLHRITHTGERPYACPVPGCEKAYSNRSNRLKHVRTHQVAKPFGCKFPGCTKRYTDPSSLRKHVKANKHFTNVPIKEEEVQN